MKKVYMLIVLSFSYCFLCGGERKPIFIINEDDSHFYYSFPAEKMTEQGALEYINKFKGSKVTHFFICTNAQRAGFRSNARQAIWDAPASGISFEECFVRKSLKITRKWVQNAKLCHERNVDIFKIWINRCREIGISPWISMRMNDMHFPHFKDFIGHDKFVFEHPEYRRLLKRAKNTHWDSYSLNYKHKEVRDYQLAFVRELFERYDFDGFELDWMRYSLHLSPNKGEQEAHLLTDFMREVKKVAQEYEKKRGHKIGIAVRVHNTPDGAKFAGLDIKTWLDEKLIDILVTSSRQTVDFNISCNDWKSALGENSKNIKIIAATDTCPAGNLSLPKIKFDRAIFNAWTENAWYNGADGVYYFNLIYLHNLIKDIIKDGVEENFVRDLPRRHGVSYHDLIEPRNISDRKAQLPKSTDVANEFSVQFANLPKYKNAKISVMASFDECDTPPICEVSLNGVKSISTENVSTLAKNDKVKFSTRYHFPTTAIKEGKNIIVIGKSSTPARVIWLELDCNVESK